LDKMVDSKKSSMDFLAMAGEEGDALDMDQHLIPDNERSKGKSRTQKKKEAKARKRAAALEEERKKKEAEAKLQKEKAERERKAAVEKKRKEEELAKKKELEAFKNSSMDDWDADEDDDVDDAVTPNSEGDASASTDVNAPCGANDNDEIFELIKWETEDQCADAADSIEKKLYRSKRDICGFIRKLIDTVAPALDKEALEDIIDLVDDAKANKFSGAATPGNADYDDDAGDDDFM